MTRWMSHPMLHQLTSVPLCRETCPGMRWIVISNAFVCDPLQPPGVSMSVDFRHGRGRGGGGRTRLRLIAVEH